MAMIHMHGSFDHIRRHLLQKNARQNFDWQVTSTWILVIVVIAWRSGIRIQLRPCVRLNFPNFSFSRVLEMFGCRNRKTCSDSKTDSKVWLKVRNAGPYESWYNWKTSRFWKEIENKPWTMIRQCCATFFSQTRFLPVVVVAVVIVVCCSGQIVAACNKILTFTLKNSVEF